MNMTKTQVTQAAVPHPEIAKLAQFLTAQTLEFMAKYAAPEFQHDQKLHAELAKLMAAAKCLPVIQAEIDALKAGLAKTKGPACPAGMIEHHTKIGGVELVFHFEYLSAEKIQ